MHSIKRWVIKDNSQEPCGDSFKELGISEITASILRKRGINSIHEAKRFLYPDIHEMHDPFHLPDMAQAVEVLRENIDLNKKIFVYGDYDADGITSTSMLIRVLKALGANVDYYIPRRSDEGYGLNQDAINEIISNGAELIVTVDCGVSAISEVEYCNKIGLKIIITDHHECGHVLPDTLVVNPKREDSSYPFKNLAGVGVAFKLIQGLSKYYSSIIPENYLDLAALGTIADIVPLVDENRIIVKHGIEAIKTTLNPGIKALIDCAGINPPDLNSGHVSFSIVPRINAIGRMDTADDAVELFTATDNAEAFKLALKLDDANKMRQSVEDMIFKEADEKIINEYLAGDDYIYVLESEKWHVGVVGIVASKIVDKYYRPAIMLCREGNILRGSARGIQGLNLYDLLYKCSDLLVKFGGHELAAGLSISAENLQAFKEKVNITAKSMLPGRYLVPTVNVDCEIKPDEISLDLIRELKLLEPLGTGNPSPLFLGKSLSIQEIRTVGNQDKHLKLKLLDKYKTFDAIAFNMGYNIKGYNKNNYIDIVCGLEINSWNGSENVQIMIRDIRHTLSAEWEEDYCRSFNKSLNRFCHNEKTYGDFFNFNIIPKPLDYILDEMAKSPKSMIFIGNINSLGLLSGLENLFDIYVEKNPGTTGIKPLLIINPDIGNICFDGVDNIYLMDNIIDYEAIFEVQKKDRYIKWHILKEDVDNDMEFLNSIYPSRALLEGIYVYLKKSIMNGYSRYTLEKISQALSYNKILTYFCLKVLYEIGVISMSSSGDKNMDIRIIAREKTAIENSMTIKKFEQLKIMLNKIKIYFQKIKGEYK